MPTVSYRSPVDASQRELFASHERPGALERLIPPWQNVRILERHGGIHNGGTVVLSIPIGPLRRRWVARHFDYEPPRQFKDEQVSGPFARWIHTHLCLPVEGAEDGAEQHSQLQDRIEYEPPFGAAGRLVAGRRIRRELDRMFLFRHRRTAGDLRRHSRFRDLPPLRVVISGASGLVGQALRAFLTTGGHQVDVLVRRAAKGAAQSSAREIPWDPAAGTIDAAALEGADAVVHLSGENIASGRWTAARKRRFATSRVDSTRLLSETLAKLRRPPNVLVCASAVGLYGDRGDEPLTESSPAGTGFLAELCRQWEAASTPAEDVGIRVARLRIGAVIAASGGALATMLRPFRLGLGGVIGSGRQYMSWISLDDLVGVVHEAIFNPDLSGAVNAVAPEPVTNRQFVKTMGRVLRRPTVMPLPATAVNLLFGEMGRTILLEGARVLPATLQAAGFEFRHPTLESAIRAELGREAIPAGWGNE